jgi:hypothetical protein
LHIVYEYESAKHIKTKYYNKDNILFRTQGWAKWYNTTKLMFKRSMNDKKLVKPVTGVEDYKIGPKFNFSIPWSILKQYNMISKINIKEIHINIKFSCGGPRFQNVALQR